MRKTISFFVIILLLSLISNASTITIVNINDNGVGSLRAAIDSSTNGDTIRFEPTLISNGSVTLTLTNEIAFSKALTIKGVYNTTDTLYINGNHNSRIFGITYTQNVTLDSLVLINGNGSGATSFSNGGAVLFKLSDSLFITNSLFRGNSASNGGGVYSFSFSHSFVSVINSAFSNNFSNNGGGGVFSMADTTSVYIINSIFNDNSTNSGAGGGVFSAALTSPSLSSVNVTNSVFSSNFAGNKGGGVYCGAETTVVNVNGSTFNDNVVTNGSGGGVFSFGEIVSSVHVTNSNFSANFATQNGGGITSFISTIINPSLSSLHLSTTSVINSTFNNNSAGQNGGGIASYATTSLPNTINSNINVINSTLSNNSADQNGGGVYVAADINSTLSIGSSILFNSSIENTGISISNGYNIFDSSPIWATATGDQTNITATQLNLGVLAYNGGNTQTMLPLVGSVAIDMGNPNDISNAQNRGITGTRREVGAAEISLATSTLTACGSYTWSQNNITYTSSGIYKDTLLNTVGNDSVITLNLTIVSQINETITMINTILSANITTVKATYHWINCINNAPVLGEINPNYIATSNGSYAVVITEESCIDTSSCVSVITVNIEELEILKMEIYPNPTFNNFTITLSEQFKKSELIIRNTLGQVVYQKTINQNKLILNAKAIGLSSGVYHITIGNEKQFISKKLIVE